MDGAGTRMRRGLLRRWSCAGLSWKTHRSASALYCPRTALFARHDRLLGECHGRPAFLCGQLRCRSRITECVARADCATAQSRCAKPAHRRATGSRPTLKPLYHRLRPRRLLATLLRPNERGAHRDPSLDRISGGEGASFEVPTFSGSIRSASRTSSATLTIPSFRIPRPRCCFTVRLVIPSSASDLLVERTGRRAGDSGGSRSHDVA